MTEASATAIKRFSQLLSRAEKILLITHERPDGDGISAVLATHWTLQALGKQTTCVTRDPIPMAFRFLPGAEVFQTDFFIGDYDLVVTFDCGDARRTSFEDRLAWFAKTKRSLVNVDHHPKNDLHRLANINIVNYDASATGQVMYHLYRYLNWDIDYRIATCLLCGIYTDTGGFKHPNTTAEILQITADLLARGARLKAISRQFVSQRSVSMLRLWGTALNRLRCHHEFGIVSSMVTLKDIENCEADSTEVAGIVNLIKNIPNTKIAILFLEQLDGSIRASLRSDVPGVDVTKIAAYFGGGGLKKAGGFTFTGQFVELEQKWFVDWNSCPVHLYH